MVNNSLAQQPKKNFKFSVAIKSDAYKNMINNTLGDPNRAQRFIASISSAVGTNMQLQECEAGSIISGALVGEALNLSPSPQLGQYYLVPYWNKERKCDVAQFQIGYKGYIQLAIRSGQYKRLNVIDIKEGELKHFDPLDETIDCIIIDDEEAREKAKTIGYYAMFELNNGFRKAMYWSKSKMLSHADRYSQAFSKDATTIHTKKGDYTKVSFSDFEAGKFDAKNAWIYSSFWYKDFDGMAFKTMLRQLISKWGVMSIDMQTAMENDMAAIYDDGKHEYVDTDGEEMPEQEPEAPKDEPQPEPQGTASEDPLA